MIFAPFDHVYGIAGHDSSKSWKVQIDHTHGWHGAPWIAHTLAEVRGSGWHKGPRDERGVRAGTMHDGNPNGYYLLKFTGRSVQPRFIPQGHKGNHEIRMRIVLDPLLIGTIDSLGNNRSINRGSIFSRAN